MESLNQYTIPVTLLTSYRLSVGGLHVGCAGLLAPIVLRCNLLDYVDLFFILCTEEKAYASGLALVVQNGSELAETEPCIYSLEYVAFPRVYDSLYLLTKLEK